MRRYVPPWWACPVLWRKAVVAWDASAPLHDHDAGGRPLLSAGAVQPFAVDVRREFLVTSGRCARNTAVSTEAHSLQLFYRAGSIVPLPFKPIKAYGITTFPLQRKQSMKTSVPIRIHNRPDNVLCQPRLQCQYAYTIDWTMFYASLDRELSYLLQQESSINMQQYNRSIILLSE